MINDRLESLLRSAGNSEPLPPKSAPDLTERVLRIAAERQKQRRRRIIAAGLVGCYLGGMLTVWIFLLSASMRTNAGIQVAKQKMESAPRNPPVPVIDHRVGPQNERPIETTVSDPLFHDGSSPQKTLYELFRDLGDASHARGDFTSAVRYYRLALDSASEVDLYRAADQDNFLLLSLKQDRIESIPQKSQGESI